MPVFLNKVERANPQDKTQKKWYCTIKTVKQTSERDVAVLIADETTINRKEAEKSIAQLEKVLINCLL
jgi:hypothetical protein